LLPFFVTSLSRKAGGGACIIEAAWRHNHVCKAASVSGIGMAAWQRNRRHGVMRAQQALIVP